jgi:indolepyruvate ferredoxin oxidoreductase beta subunit
MNKGRNVRTAETIGMAQRGGCVVSHVRTGEEIHSPLIPLGGADVIIGFEPAEAVRCLSYLKPGGTVIVNSKAIKPVTSALGGAPYEGGEMLAYLKNNISNLKIIDGEAVCESCGSSKVLNIALLAAAAQSACLEIGIEELKETVKRMVNPKLLDMNLKAIDMACGFAN